MSLRARGFMGQVSLLCELIKVKVKFKVIFGCKMTLFPLLLTGGPYASFAGHDASRALAMFQTDAVKEDYDDLSDLNSSQMESVREWEGQLGG